MSSERFGVVSLGEGDDEMLLRGWRSSQGGLEGIVLLLLVELSGVLMSSKPKRRRSVEVLLRVSTRIRMDPVEVGE
jgi:hypothetical protein